MQIILHYSQKLLLLLIILSGFLHSAQAAQTPITIKVKTAEKLPIEKELQNLAKEMEQIAKSYKTSDQTSYWESEGKKSFDKLLKAEGYYANAVDVETLIGGKKNTLIFHISVWQRYKIDSIEIKHKAHSNTDIKMPKLSDLSIKIGKYAIAQNILEAQRQITDYIENHNCLFSIDVSHQAIINHLDKKISVIFIVNAGPSATIEKVDFTGLKTVNSEYVHKLAKLKDGQCFRNSYITESRGSLQKSGLFATTKPIIPEKINEDGSVPVTFDLSERKPRSIKFGFGYSTDLGLGASAGWEHRNFFGDGEKVTTTLFGNKREQSINIDFIKPFFKRDDQTLKLGLELENLVTKAYNSREGTMSAFIERDFSDDITGGIGSRFSQAEIKAREDHKWNSASLFSIPLFLAHDTRNNILDPRNGHEIKTEVIPFFNTHTRTKPFTKTKISTSVYFPVPAKLHPVIAVRAATGSIFDVKLDTIPYTERFFVGGSGSLRGYTQQLAGKLTSANNPIGGRSFLETSIELRLRMSESIGIVGFLDSGFAYSDQIIPLKNQKILHGAGVGLRYITDFGPLRLDVGFPLKRRKFIDHAWQLYFGIGQSF
jgi:translocation and assembly module TamA